MLCDTSGKPLYRGSKVKEYTWDISNDTALPSWLVSQGTSPIITFGSVASGRGTCTIQTKSTTPTSGDLAGIKTAFNIDTASLAEISFMVFGLTQDGSPTDQNMSFSFNNGSTAGLYLQNNQSGGKTQTRIYPSAARDLNYHELALGSNSARRKNVGITIFPKTKEVLFSEGDPYETGCWGYDKGNWNDLTGQPFIMQIVTRKAAQSSMTFEGVKLRLGYW